MVSMKKTSLIFLTVITSFGILFFFLWMNKPKNQCSIPIHFMGCLDTPSTTIKIEKKSYELIFDLGCGHSCSLDEEVLKNIKKKKLLGSVSWLDLKGRSYETANYLLPKIKWGKATFENIPVKVESKECRRNSLGLDSTEEVEKYYGKIVGKIGGGLFLMSHVNALFLDLAHSVAFMIEDIRQFHENGYCMQNMTKVPLEKTDAGFSIQVNTGSGEKRFLLDTGASNNGISTSLFPEEKENHNPSKEFLVTAPKFVMGGRDFGPEKFLLYDIGTDLNIDGILGMSFFKKHAVLIDFANEIVYIGQ
jgi:hypothetical protein